MINLSSLGEKGHFLTNRFLTTCFQLCFDYTIIFIWRNSTWMGWHLKWVDVSTSLVSVWHWPLTGVDHQNIFLNKIQPSWGVVENSSLPWHYATSSQLLDYFSRPCFWMDEIRILMNEILHAFSIVLQLELSLPIPYPHYTYSPTYLSLFTPYVHVTYLLL